MTQNTTDDALMLDHARRVLPKIADELVVPIDELSVEALAIFLKAERDLDHLRMRLIVQLDGRDNGLVSRASAVNAVRAALSRHTPESQTSDAMVAKIAALLKKHRAARYGEQAVASDEPIDTENAREIITAIQGEVQ